MVGLSVVQQACPWSSPWSIGCAAHTRRSVTEPALPMAADNMSVGLGTIKTDEPCSNSFVCRVCANW